MELFAGIAALTSIIGYLGFQVYNEVKGFAELDAVSFLENNATVEPLEFPLNIDKPVEQVLSSLYRVLCLLCLGGGGRKLGDEAASYLGKRR